MLTRNLLHSVLMFACLLSGIAARPYRNSHIQRIVVPYQRNIVSGHPYQYPKVVGESRHVLVPDKIDMVSGFGLDRNAMTMSGVHGTGAAGPIAMPVNFADGAYPVYYMPGNANGRFNGKISLLT